MADAHGNKDLSQLEREAEAARARLQETLAKIRDPRTADKARLELKQSADELKDQIVGYITGATDEVLETGRASSSEFTRKLQRTAVENPLSVALIGAGIGWHLYKKPPITTILIGTGVWMLMKGWNNSPDETAFRDPYNSVSPRGYVPGGVAGYGYDDVTGIASAAERVRTVATNLSYGAQEAISGAADHMREAVGAGADSLRTAGAHAADDMSRLGADVAHRASQQVEDATARGQDLAQEAKGAIEGVADEARDLAKGAQRRLQPVIDRVSPWLDAQHRGKLGVALVLGGVGVLAGGWLRNSDTGRRWMNEARHGVDEAMSHVSEQASSMRHQALDTAGDMREQGAASLHKVEELGSEHPLLLSAIGLAIGAVLGGMIRQTSFERESLGDMAGTLRDSVANTLQTGMDAVADRASSVARAVSEAASETTGELEKAAGSLRNRVPA